MYINFVNMKFIEKTDPLTGEMFFPSRSNQVFANDENRIKYNNLKAKTFRDRKSFVDKPLHTNLRILNALMGTKTELELHRQFLIGRGFDVQVFTHSVELNGKDYYAIYEFVIIPLTNDQIKIVRK